MRKARPRPTEIAFYEGLVFKTASMYAPLIEEDFEDIKQILSIKVWRALESYDPARATQPVEGYVFSCVKNQVKDLLRRKHRNLLWLEEVAGSEQRGEDAFHRRYLGIEADQVFRDPDQPLIPSTLGHGERIVLGLLYLDYNQREIAKRLDMTRSEMERTVAGIRTKMADWRPGSSPPIALAA